MKLPANHTWSWSSISQAQRCSLAFSLSSRRLLGSGLLSRRPDATNIGLAIHRAAKFLLEREGSMTLVIPDNLRLPPEYFRNLALFVGVQLPRLRRLMGEGVETHPELQIRLDKKLKPTYGWPNGFIVGTLDLALYNPKTRSALVLDFKTGDLDSDSLVSYYRPQLELYSFLFNRGHRPIERVGLLIHAVHSGELHWLTDELEPYDDERGYQLLRSELQAAVENLSSIRPQINPLCKYCDHRAQCPAYEEDE